MTDTLTASVDMFVNAAAQHVTFDRESSTATLRDGNGVTHTIANVTDHGTFAIPLVYHSQLPFQSALAAARHLARSEKPLNLDLLKAQFCILDELGFDITDLHDANVIEALERAQAKQKKASTTEPSPTQGAEFTAGDATQEPVSESPVRATTTVPAGDSNEQLLDNRTADGAEASRPPPAASASRHRANSAKEEIYLDAVDDVDAGPNARKRRDPNVKGEIRLDVDDVVNAGDEERQPRSNSVDSVINIDARGDVSPTSTYNASGSAGNAGPGPVSAAAKRGGGVHVEHFVADDDDDDDGGGNDGGDDNFGMSATLPRNTSHGRRLARSRTTPKSKLYTPPSKRRIASAAGASSGDHASFSVDPAKTVSQLLSSTQRVDADGAPPRPDAGTRFRANMRCGPELFSTDPSPSMAATVTGSLSPAATGVGSPSPRRTTGNRRTKSHIVFKDIIMPECAASVTPDGDAASSAENVASAARQAASEGASSASIFADTEEAARAAFSTAAFDADSSATANDATHARSQALARAMVEQLHDAVKKLDAAGCHGLRLASEALATARAAQRATSDNAASTASTSEQCAAAALAASAAHEASVAASAAARTTADNAVAMECRLMAAQASATQAINAQAGLLSAAIDSLQHRVFNVETSQADMQSHLESMRRSMGELRDVNTASRSQIDEVLNHHAAARAESARSNASLLDLASRVHTQQQTNTSLADELSRLGADHTATRAMAYNASTGVHDLRELVQAASTRAAEARNQAESAFAAAEAASKTSADLRGEFNSLGELFKATAEDAERTKNSVQDVIARANTDFATLSAALDRNSVQNTATAATAREAQRTAADASARTTTLFALHKELQTAQRQSTAGTEAEFKRLGDEVAELASKSVIADTRSAAESARVNRLSSDLESARANLRDQTTSVAHLRTRFDGFASDIQDVRSKQSNMDAELNARIEAINVDVATAASAVASNEAELTQSLKRLASQLSSASKSAEDSHALLSDRVDRLQRFVMAQLDILMEHVDATATDVKRHNEAYTDAKSFEAKTDIQTLSAETTAAIQSATREVSASRDETMVQLAAQTSKFTVETAQAKLDLESKLEAQKADAESKRRLDVHERDQQLSELRGDFSKQLKERDVVDQQRRALAAQAAEDAAAEHRRATSSAAQSVSALVAHYSFFELKALSDREDQERRGIRLAEGEAFDAAARLREHDVTSLRRLTTLSSAPSRASSSANSSLKCTPIAERSTPCTTGNNQPPRPPPLHSSLSMQSSVRDDSDADVEILPTPTVQTNGPSCGGHRYRHRGTSAAAAACAARLATSSFGGGLMGRRSSSPASHRSQPTIRQATAAAPDGYGSSSSSSSSSDDSGDAFGDAMRADLTRKLAEAAEQQRRARERLAEVEARALAEENQKRVAAKRAAKRRRKEEARAAAYASIRAEFDLQFEALATANAAIEDKLAAHAQHSSSSSSVLVSAMSSEEPSSTASHRGGPLPHDSGLNASVGSNATAAGPSNRNIPSSAAFFPRNGRSLSRSHDFGHDQDADNPGAGEPAARNPTSGAAEGGNNPADDDGSSSGSPGDSAPGGGHGAGSRDNNAGGGSGSGGGGHDPGGPTISGGVLRRARRADGDDSDDEGDGHSGSNSGATTPVPDMDTDGFCPIPHMAHIAARGLIGRRQSTSMFAEGARTVPGGAAAGGKSFFEATSAQRDAVILPVLHLSGRPYFASVADWAAISTIERRERLLKGRLFDSMALRGMVGHHSPGWSVFGIRGSLTVNVSNASLPMLRDSLVKEASAINKHELTAAYRTVSRKANAQLPQTAWNLAQRMTNIHSAPAFAANMTFADIKRNVVPLTIAFMLIVAPVAHRLDALSQLFHLVVELTFSHDAVSVCRRNIRLISDYLGDSPVASGPFRTDVYDDRNWYLFVEFLGIHVVDESGARFKGSNSPPAATSGGGNNTANGGSQQQQQNPAATAGASAATASQGGGGKGKNGRRHKTATTDPDVHRLTQEKKALQRQVNKLQDESKQQQSQQQPAQQQPTQPQQKVETKTAPASAKASQGGSSGAALFARLPHSMAAMPTEFFSHETSAASNKKIGVENDLLAGRATGPATLTSMRAAGASIVPVDGALSSPESSPLPSRSVSPSVASSSADEPDPAMPAPAAHPRQDDAYPPPTVSPVPSDARQCASEAPAARISASAALTASRPAARLPNLITAAERAHRGRKDLTVHNRGEKATDVMKRDFLSGRYYIIRYRSKSSTSLPSGTCAVGCVKVTSKSGGVPKFAFIADIYDSTGVEYDWSLARHAADHFIYGLRTVADKTHFSEFDAAADGATDEPSTPELLASSATALHPSATEPASQPAPGTPRESGQTTPPTHDGPDPDNTDEPSDADTEHDSAGNDSVEPDAAASADGEQPGSALLPLQVARVYDDSKAKPLKPKDMHARLSACQVGDEILIAWSRLQNRERMVWRGNVTRKHNNKTLSIRYTAAPRGGTVTTPEGTVSVDNNSFRVFGIWRTADFAVEPALNAAAAPFVPSATSSSSPAGLLAHTAPPDYDQANRDADGHIVEMSAADLTIFNSRPLYTRVADLHASASPATRGTVGRLRPNDCIAFTFVDGQNNGTFIHEVVVTGFNKNNMVLTMNHRGTKFTLPPPGGKLASVKMLRPFRLASVAPPGDGNEVGFGHLAGAPDVRSVGDVAPGSFSARSRRHDSPGALPCPDFGLRTDPEHAGPLLGPSRSSDCGSDQPSGIGASLGTVDTADLRGQLRGRSQAHRPLHHSLGLSSLRRSSAASSGITNVQRRESPLGFEELSNGCSSASGGHKCAGVATLQDACPREEDRPSSASRDLLVYSGPGWRHGTTPQTGRRPVGRNSDACDVASRKNSCETRPVQCTDDTASRLVQDREGISRLQNGCALVPRGGTQPRPVGRSPSRRTALHRPAPGTTQLPPRCSSNDGRRPDGLRRNAARVQRPHVHQDAPHVSELWPVRREHGSPDGGGQLESSPAGASRPDAVEPASASDVLDPELLFAFDDLPLLDGDESAETSEHSATTDRTSTSASSSSLPTASSHMWPEASCPSRAPSYASALSPDWDMSNRQISVNDHSHYAFDDTPMDAALTVPRPNQNKNNGVVVRADGSISATYIDPKSHMSTPDRAAAFPLYVRKQLEAWNMSALRRVITTLKNPILRDCVVLALSWLEPERLAHLLDIPNGDRYACRARYTEGEMQRLIDGGSIGVVKKFIMTCRCFGVIEAERERTRPIAWTKLLNEMIDNFDLQELDLPQPRDCHDVVLYANYFCQIDLISSFTQVPIPTHLQEMTAFQGPTSDTYYGWLRMPMGLCFAVEVMQFSVLAMAAPDSDYIEGYAISREEYYDLVRRARDVKMLVYVDNVLYHGERDAVAAATELFLIRCRYVGVSLHPVGEPVRHDSFIGIEMDLEGRWMRTSDKTINRLAKIRSYADGGTHRQLASLLGLLWRDAYVAGTRMCKHFFCIRWCARALTLTPDDPRWEQPVAMPDSIRSRLEFWIDDVMKRKKIYPRPSKEEIDHVLITDAAASGIGAYLINWRTRERKVVRLPWHTDENGESEYHHSCSGESMGVFYALRHFFPLGTTDHIAIVSDSSAAVAGLRKFNSLSKTVNHALVLIDNAFPDARFTSVHVAGKVNAADSPSRNEQDDFEEQKLEYALWLVEHLPSLTRESMQQAKMKLGIDVL